jgi:predicted SAM-dependent methyltransferase
MLKLNLGSGDNPLEGFINIDKYDKKADVCADITELPYDNQSCDEVHAYQVFEHIAYNLSEELFKEVTRVLAPGGKLVIEVPDIDWTAKRILETGIDHIVLIMLYGEYHRPWDKTRYEDWNRTANGIHINAWNYARFEEYAKKYNYSIRKRTTEEKHRDYKMEENLSVELIKL